MAYNLRFSRFSLLSTGIPSRYHGILCMQISKWTLYMPIHVSQSYSSPNTLSHKTIGCHLCTVFWTWLHLHLMKTLLWVQNGNKKFESQFDKFFLTKLNLGLPYDSTIPLLDIYRRENGTESMHRLTQQCSQVFNDKFSSLEKGSKACSVPTMSNDHAKEDLMIQTQWVHLQIKWQRKPGIL